MRPKTDALSNCLALSNFNEGFADTVNNNIVFFVSFKISRNNLVTEFQYIEEQTALNQN